MTVCVLRHLGFRFRKINNRVRIMERKDLHRWRLIELVWTKFKNRVCKENTEMKVDTIKAP